MVDKISMKVNRKLEIKYWHRAFGRFFFLVFWRVFFLGGGFFWLFFFFVLVLVFFVVDVLMFCFERDVSVLTICQKKNPIF